MILLGLIENILTLSSVPSFWIDAIYGLIILAALIFGAITGRLRGVRADPGADCVDHRHRAGRHDGTMNARSTNRPLGAVGAVLSVMVALLMCGPAAGLAQAAVAAPAGDALSIGDPDALGQIDLYVDPLCPYSGKMVRAQGGEIGKRMEAGTLHVNLRFVDFLDKHSASGTYDSRAIYAAYVVADQSRSSDITWRFVQQMYSDDLQPKENGPTDLTNDQLADVADRVGAPQPTGDLIRAGLPIGYDPHAVAADNLAVLHEFPKPGVPLVVINGRPVDGESDWLAQLPG